MILIEDLTVRFGGVVSLDAVRAELPVGTVGLIGPNGAGKTTLLNVLSGFVPPTAGRVVAFGENLSGMPAHRRARWGVRRTFQTEQAIGALSVAENVAMVHEHCGSGRRDRRAAVDRALEFAGLTGQRDRPVGGLSAADRRCVELARAVVGRPRVVLLDEPAAGLPEAELPALAEVVGAVRERDAGVLLIDHNMALIMELCDRIHVLDQGVTLAEGTPVEIRSNLDVAAAYLGERPVVDG